MKVFLPVQWDYSFVVTAVVFCLCKKKYWVSHASNQHQQSYGSSLWGNSLTFWQISSFIFFARVAWEDRHLIIRVALLGLLLSCTYKHAMHVGGDAAQKYWLDCPACKWFQYVIVALNHTNKSVHQGALEVLLCRFFLTYEIRQLDLSPLFPVFVLS